MTTCPTSSISPHPDREFDGDEASPEFASRTLFQRRLREKMARLEAIQREEERLREDADQLRELLDPRCVGGAKLAIRSRNEAKRALQRFLQKRRRTARLQLLGRQLREEIEQDIYQVENGAFIPATTSQPLRSLEALTQQLADFPK